MLPVPPPTAATPMSAYLFAARDDEAALAMLDRGPVPPAPHLPLAGMSADALRLLFCALGAGEFAGFRDLGTHRSPARILAPHEAVRDALAACTSLEVQHLAGALVVEFEAHGIAAGGPAELTWLLHRWRDAARAARDAGLRLFVRLAPATGPNAGADLR